MRRAARGTHETGRRAQRARPRPQPGRDRPRGARAIGSGRAALSARPRPPAGRSARRHPHPVPRPGLRGEPGVHSRQIDWAEAAGVRPAAVMVAPCGFGLDAARVQAAGVPALADSLIIAVDAAGYYVRSGPRVVDGIEALAAALHPDA